MFLKHNSISHLFSLHIYQVEVHKLCYRNPFQKLTIRQRFGSAYWRTVVRVGLFSWSFDEGIVNDQDTLPYI